ncbi:MAG: response regulator transcription factor [Nostocoides sp.]
MARLLVVEDDADIALALRTLLVRAGHEVAEAADGALGLRRLHERHPDLVILDLGLPVMDGWELLRRIRDVTDVPVMLLTAAGREEDKVRGLRGGADDYLTKPYPTAELLARVDALLRRSGQTRYSADDSVHGIVVLSPARHAVTVGSEPVPVSPLEFRLLSTFMQHEGQVLTAEQLLDQVWDDPTGIGPERVKFAVLRLRKKLGWADPATTPLVAVRGIGYRLDPPASA